MSTATQPAEHAPALERVLSEFEALLSALPDAVLTRAARRRAAEQLRRLGWPNSRDEQWRYTNLRAFERLPSFAPRAPVALDAPAVETLRVAVPAPLPGLERLLFVDGVRCSGDTGTARGADEQRGAAQPLPFPGEPAWSGGQRLALLNDLFAQDAAVLRIRGRAAVELLFLHRGGATYPRVQIELADGGELTLVERHLGVDGTAGGGLVDAATLVELGRGSRLTHYRVQQCSPTTLVCEALSARLQAQASYEVRQLSLGGAQARTSARICLGGRGARLGWQAVAVGRTDQVQDTSVDVEHAAPATHTEETFRGIAEERARLAFSAHIHIQSSAPGAQARQSLRGLIEGSSAEIDLRPRLQIDTDEVTAQHGATTGRLDEQLLFYLLARGIDRQTARALLKWAFLGDVLRAIELPALRAQIERAAAGQLHDVLGLAALATVPAEQA